MKELSFMKEVLIDLISIPSINPPGNEKVIAEKIGNIFRKIGINYKIYNLGCNRANIIGEIEGKKKGPVLVLNGHLDTVPPSDNWSFDPFRCKVIGKRIYGLGAVDMKGAIAAMIWTGMKFFKKKDEMSGKLILAFVADEEKNNKGTINFLKKFKEIDYCVIGEPTNLEIVTSSRGCIRFKIFTYGKSAHCSNPESGINAIYKMCTVIERLKKYVNSINRIHHQQKPSLSINIIKGGISENVIPDKCEIVVDRRITYEEKINEVKENILEILKSICLEDEEFKYDYEIIEQMEPYKIKMGSKLLEITSESYSKYFFKKPFFKDLGASCEASIFTKEGIDTIVLGPGNIECAHAKNEFIEDKQLIEAAKFYYFLVKNILQTDT